MISKVKKQNKPEKEIVKEIKDYLKLMGWFVFHVHSQSRYSYEGISDLIACKMGMVVFIEVKTETGRQSKEQIKFEKDIKDQHCHYLLARSIDDIIDFFKKNILGWQCYR